MKIITIKRKTGDIIITCKNEDDVLEVLKEHEIKNAQSIQTEIIK